MKESRKEALAKALMDNMMRRKQQMKARAKEAASKTERQKNEHKT